MFVFLGKGFLSEYMDDINLAGKKQDIDPMWKKYSTKKSIWEKKNAKRMSVKQNSS